MLQLAQFINTRAMHPCSKISARTPLYSQRARPYSYPRTTTQQLAQRRRRLVRHRRGREEEALRRGDSKRGVQLRADEQSLSLPIVTDCAARACRSVYRVVGQFCGSVFFVAIISPAQRLQLRTRRMHRGSSRRSRGRPLWPS